LERLASKVGTSPRSVRVAAAILASVFVLAACGGQDPSGNSPQASGEGSEATVARSTGGAAEEKTAAEEALTPAEARIGPKESANMVPAGGKKPDPAQPPPQDPPEGVETFPATTNRIVERDVEYARKPPTNGDHAPLWQNCGFYEKPVRDENAVHSLDHGAVWITYRDELPQEQLDTLRQLARERYVLVSPYPGQGAPVIATAWRNQLRLDRADDPRLRRFVDQFRVSETAPLSGNGCTGGVGNPKA
jgi:Protein of unknown function (DUF3105)